MKMKRKQTMESKLQGRKMNARIDCLEEKAEWSSPSLWLVKTDSLD